MKKIFAALIILVVGFIVLVPVLVVGGWYVVITVIMGLADGAIWLLDRGWRKIRPRIKPAPSLGLGAANSGTQAVPVLTAPLAVTSNVYVMGQIESQNVR